jgi:probable addiction module antidote protein
VFQDPKRAIGYLNNALEEGDLDVFLVALKNIVEIHGGMSKLSRTTKLNRGNLYRLLSKNGNPEVHTLDHVLRALGLRLAVTTDKKTHLKKAA